MLLFCVILLSNTQYHVCVLKLICSSVCLYLCLHECMSVIICTPAMPGWLACLLCVRVCVHVCVSSRESWASSALLFQRNWRRPGGNYTPLLRLVKTSSNQGLLLQSGTKHTHTHTHTHLHTNTAVAAFAYNLQSISLHFHNAISNRVNGEKIIKMKVHHIEWNNRSWAVTWCEVVFVDQLPTVYCLCLICCVFVRVIACMLLRLCCYGNTRVGHWPGSVQNCARVECICALLCVRLSAILMICLFTVGLNLAVTDTCHT